MTDYCYVSDEVILLFQPKDPGFHSQEKVYHDLGEEMLDHSFEGKSEIFIHQCIHRIVTWSHFGTVKENN